MLPFVHTATFIWRGEGCRENGKFVTPFTTLGALFARSNQYHHAFCYNLPPR
ncbi:MAG TPA: hypothetical protein VGO56_01460 [Pyrinomonadaceae bacterium]|nr:hypothetical protein [Pyrinomonadaceae bacterium]